MTTRKKANAQTALQCGESIFTIKHNNNYYYVPQDYKYSTSSLQSLTNCFSVVVTFSMSNPLIG